MTLFEELEKNDDGASFKRFAPLAERMRPVDLAGFIGQEHLVGSGKVLEKMINEDFDKFVYVVSRGRNISTEEVLRYSDGNVWSGTQTVAYKLADRVGTLDTAIEELKVSAGLKNPKISFFQIADDGSISNMSYESMRYQYEPSIYIQKK